MSEMKLKIRVNTNYIVNVLAFIAMLLIIMGIVVAILLTYTPYKTALGIIPFFNMDLESTITSYYSSFILLFSATILSFIAQECKSIENSYWRHWYGLSIGFLFLSIDESASIHEFLANVPLHYLNISARINFSIAILGFIATLILLLFYFKFLLYLPAKTRNRFIIAGAMYVSAAFGAELIGGFISLYSKNLDAGIYLVEVVIEESFEIVSIVLFIKYLFLYIEENLINTMSIFSSLPERINSEMAAKK
ncbi:hypothetical protein F1C16_07935 [Hymenobacter sp. NBH84]|uniref:hypothetical protein n=1 Tax=Hymenobacter sp. NBH84 TaxID=2596915 RepID=UPI001627A3AD|nr:hypothetical protein [Hymenobacter sp. NBH84]QNE39485.1 hypothetical protein F1C16_07935 [Hymenobacter sp. NBH84]